MDLIAFRRDCFGRRVLAVVLTTEDFHQMARTYEAQGTKRIPTHYEGAPILYTEFGRSYLLEDSPDGPLIHRIP